MIQQLIDAVLADWTAAVAVWAVLLLVAVVVGVCLVQYGRRLGWEDRVRHEGRMKVLKAIEDELARVARTQPIPPSERVPTQREPS